MQHFKNILCVISPGEACRPTLERALTLAENNQAGLTVVDVIPQISVGYGLPDSGPVSIDLRTLVKSEHEQALASFIAPYCERMPMRHAVLMGTDFLEIIRQVLRHGHDLVIKPADNPSFIDRLFGSEDMHLLRKCPCPVWLSKPGETPKYSCVMAAIDFDMDTPNEVADRLNERILELASAFAVADFAALHFVHVWDAPFEMTVRIWGHDQNAADGYVERERLRHRQALDRLRERLEARLGAETFGYLAPRFHLHRGPPSEAIPALARQLQADIVVMGTLGRTGVAGLFIGNTAETILEQLTCSVLAVKPPGFVSPVTLDAQ